MNAWDKKRSVMSRYNLTANMYDMRYAEEQTAKIKAALETIVLEKGSTVLDVGCGTGILFNHVADKAETVVGIDFSKQNLLQAKKHAESYQNVNLILADADSMPLKEKTFTHIFGMTLIQNMPNPAKTLSEIKRVANKDGTIIVTGMKKAFNLEGFKKLLRKIGFEVVLLKHEGLQCYVAIAKVR